MGVVSLFVIVLNTIICDGRIVGGVVYTVFGLVLLYFLFGFVADACLRYCARAGLSVAGGVEQGILIIDAAVPAMFVLAGSSKEGQCSDEQQILHA
jgi:hypothetical protein